MTIGAPDNSRFIVGINEACPADMLERVIVHELVHVHTFAQSGADDRDAMETATELAAGLVLQLHDVIKEPGFAELLRTAKPGCGCGENPCEKCRADGWVSIQEALPGGRLDGILENSDLTLETEPQGGDD